MTTKFKIFVLSSLLVFCLVANAKSKEASARYAVATVSGSALIEKKSQIGDANFPFQVATIQTDSVKSVLKLNWTNVSAKNFSTQKNVRFRLTLASGLTNYQFVEVCLPSGELLGTMDISMGCGYQMYEVFIQKNKIASVLKNGLEVRSKGKGVPVSFILWANGVPQSLAPHLLIEGNLNPRTEFYKRFVTQAGWDGYGWQGGCVLDGLAVLAATAKNDAPFKQALTNLLKAYYPQNAPLKKYPSIENTSCVAQLSMQQPTHPEIENALSFWKSRENEQGNVVDHNQVAAEGNYTVSWPMAIISKQLNRPEIAEKAISDLRFRAKYLIDEDGNQWLRYRFGIAPLRTYKHWSRGNAWYFLGMAKTMDVLPVVPADLIAEFQRAANHIAALQCNDGMWRMFATETETNPESSGTAGIATAMAIGARRGWLGKEYEAIARKALAGLESRLTPDGFLTSVAHCNRPAGGEEFQRKTKGSILKFGMGFYAQLLAELEPLNVGN